MLSPEAFIYENKLYKIYAKCKTNRAEKKIQKSADIDSKEVPIEIIVINEINNYISDMIDGLEHDIALFSTFYIKLDEATLNTAKAKAYRYRNISGSKAKNYEKPKYGS
ncbi:3825_t:CDS:2, partial [Racocetra fulgida]